MRAFDRLSDARYRRPGESRAPVNEEPEQIWGVCPCESRQHSAKRDDYDLPRESLPGENVCPSYRLNVRRGITPYPPDSGSIKRPFFCGPPLGWLGRRQAMQACRALARSTEVLAQAPPSSECQR